MVELIVLAALYGAAYLLGWALTKAFGDFMGFWFKGWTCFMFWYIMLVILSGIAIKRAFSQEKKNEYIDG